MAIPKLIALLYLPLFVRGQIPAPSYLFPGCVQTGCASKSCPSGLTLHVRAFGDSKGISCDNQDSLVCCPFPSKNAQWLPLKPLDGHHLCPTSDPCPAQNQVLIYADPRGFGGSICLDPGPASSYWYCEDQPVPNPVKTTGKYTYQGCYSDSSSSRVLTGGSYKNRDTMTVELCAQKAAAAGATYFGVEYREECYWGNTLSTASKAQDPTKCTAFCAGNQQEACGGLTGQMGLYMNPSNVIPKEVGSYKTWVSQGCYSDSADARSLPNTYTAPSGTAMTVEVCCDAAAGFKYAAVEYGKECYYGNYLQSTATQQSSGCNMPCAGSPSDLCGGGNRINLYLNNAYKQPASEKPSVGSFSSLGCYTDSSSARGLTRGSSKSTSMTVEQCVKLAAGFKYAGVEYGKECYWGDTLSSTSTQAMGQCTMACGGDASELCGDGNRMNLYINKDFSSPPTTPTTPTIPPKVGIFSYLGCYVDDPASRVLPNQNQDTSMTVERCIALATAGNAKYAGLENGNQCFFGTNLTASESDGCTKACAGDSTEACGGARRLAIYENKSYSPPPITTTKPPTIPPTSIPITITTVKPAPTVVPSVGSFSNKGCFVDQESRRVLVADSTSGGDMTVEKCVKFADDGSWQYAGVEFGKQCFVGNTLHDASSTTPSDCNQECTGNPAEACGAGNRIGVYQDSTWVDPTADQLAQVLQDYNSTLSQVLDAINDYKSHIQKLKDIRNQKKRSLNRRLAARQSETETIVLQEITRDAHELQVVRQLLDRAARNGNRLFLVAANNDIERPTSPLVNSEHLSQLQEATRRASEVLSEVTEDAIDDAASISSGGSGSPILNLERDLSAAGNAVNSIGRAGASAGVGAATGIFLAVLTLFGIFHHGGGGNTGNPPPPPPPVVTTSVITTTTTTCTPTQAPTPVVVLTTPDSTRKQYDALINDLKVNDTSVTQQMVYDSVNFRAFVADLDDCDVDNLLGNKIVSTLSRNIKGEAETFANSPAAKRNIAVDVVSEEAGPTFNPNGLDKGNFTILEKRNIPPQFSHLYVTAHLDNGIEELYPFHLDWLTSPWAQRGLTGSYLEFEHYLFDKDAELPVSVRVYVIDTGARVTHLEFENRIPNSYDASQSGIVTDVTDNDGHGTCMSSCVGGFFSGVFKQAQIVPIKIMKSGGDAPSVSTAINAIGLALQDKANSAVEAGVLSMSIGFRVEDLQVIKGQPKNTIDPFADLLDRIKSANIVAVASSGNDKTHDLNEWTPRKNGGADTKMIVVGAADHKSQRCGFSTYIDSAQKGILSLYAIGEKVICAGKGSSGVDTQYNSPSGSSPATAQVAGIVAMYLAQGLTTVADAKDYLLSEAKRLKGTNWPNDGPGAKAGPGPLRAGIGVQVPCTVDNARQATQPIWKEPDSQMFGDEVKPQRITDLESEPDCVKPIP